MSNPFALPGDQTGSNTTRGNVREFKPADRFLNWSIPRPDGTSCRFESFKLYKDNPDHAALIAGLDNGSITVEDVLTSLVGSYNTAEKSVAGLALKKAGQTAQASE